MWKKFSHCTETDQRPSFTLILAEKEPIARAALACLLSYDGYRVFQAENLDSALFQISNVEGLSVLLVDFDMPGWRSIARHAAKTTKALVIGMEGNYPFSDMYDLRQSGISVCVHKPLVYEELRKAIAFHLKTRWSMKESGTSDDLSHIRKSAA